MTKLQAMLGKSTGVLGHMPGSTRASQTCQDGSNFPASGPNFYPKPQMIRLKLNGNDYKDIPQATVISASHRTAGGSAGRY